MSNCMTYLNSVVHSCRLLLYCEIHIAILSQNNQTKCTQQKYTHISQLDFYTFIDFVNKQQVHLQTVDRNIYFDIILQISWCDMLFTHWMSWVPDGVKVTPPLDQYPKLKALTKRVESHPRIAEWLKTRPVTDL